MIPVEFKDKVAKKSGYKSWLEMVQNSKLIPGYKYEEAAKLWVEHAVWANQQKRAVK